MKVQDKLVRDRLIIGSEATTAKFRKFDNPRPYVAVIGLAIDSQGHFPIFLRSKKVRSAKNAWSLPSGLGEVGYTHDEQFGIELSEEFGLEIVPGTCEKLGFYENVVYEVSGEDNWHWVLLLLAMRVKTLDTIINKEPDKHENINIITTDELYQIYINQAWTPGLKEALLEHRTIIESTVRKLALIKPV